ncbi:MAG TPA: cupin domain-containing protein [Thauera sp.]|uniref:cupin domain-containing protein n=1 Tax=Thauera sp. TaxID=1905334 RepID=UPI002CDACE67|nr:cupin domain-containing protein [Thauera sp.]HRP26114.1 cupin domain-containing protein [Thauera sp.]HRP67728.1 cupin domain-containing protein [Thauera sp.]
MLFANRVCRVERIVSFGHASPTGFWYEQAEDEWVVLLAGTAELAFDDGRRLALKAGDWVSLPAHCRHRVESVSQDALWLAVHCRADCS